MKNYNHLRKILDKILPHVKERNGKPTGDLRGVYYNLESVIDNKNKFWVVLHRHWGGDLETTQKEVIKELENKGLTVKRVSSRIMKVEIEND